MGNVVSLPAVELEKAIAPADLRDALEGLCLAGAIEGWRLEGGAVHLAGDLVALELVVMRMCQHADSHLGPEADDVGGYRLGFRVSSDINGRRGSRTAKAADMEATRSYFEAAGALLHDPSLSNRERLIWQLHVDGLSEEKIAARVGIARRQVVRVMAVLRCKAGLTRKIEGWAALTG